MARHINGPAMDAASVVVPDSVAVKVFAEAFWGRALAGVKVTDMGEAMAGVALTPHGEEDGNFRQLFKMRSMII
jgi:hypothetical protein